MEIILGKERRRWSEDDKRRIVLETFAPGVTCHEIARRHQLSNGMLFTWRKRLRAALGFPELAPPAQRFLPVAVTGEPSAACASATPTAIDIALGAGVQVKISGAPSAVLVTAILKALARR